MSIYKDGKLIAGGRQCMPLLSFMWADHELNDISWLRADTFSWHSGAVYSAVYQHLVNDISGKTLQTETVAGTTVQFYLADDGHKICPASEESNVAAIYAATGVAWYYILDTVNQRFKLPRTKHNVVGLRDKIGGYVEPGIPNLNDVLDGVHHRSLYNTPTVGGTGLFRLSDYANCGFAGGGGTNNDAARLTIDAHNQNPIYGNSNTVQPPAVQMYLYFYVGSFAQTAIENTAGLNTELFNDKADKDFGNTTMIDYVVEKQDPSAGNNYTWYRKYASGWVEQGGQKTFSANTDSTTQNLPIAMSNTDYQVFLTKGINTGFGNAVYDPHVRTRSTTSFTYAYNTDYSGSYCFWVVYGMAA